MLQLLLLCYVVGHAEWHLALGSHSGRENRGFLHNFITEQIRLFKIYSLFHSTISYYYVIDWFVFQAPTIKTVIDTFEQNSCFMLQKLLNHLIDSSDALFKQQEVAQQPERKQSQTTVLSGSGGANDPTDFDLLYETAQQELERTRQYEAASGQRDRSRENQVMNTRQIERNILEDTFKEWMLS